MDYDMIITKFEEYCIPRKTNTLQDKAETFDDCKQTTNAEPQMWIKGTEK